MNRECFRIGSKGDWLDRRRRDVTASQAPALFGCHKWLTPLMLFQQKRGEDGQQGNLPAMRRGRILEPAVIEAVEKENPEWAPIIRKANEYWRLPDMRLGATPDAYIGEPGDPGCGMLEAKTVSPDQFEDWNGALPLQYTLQCLAQQMCTGAAWGTVAVLVTNRAFDLHIYAVPRHAAAEARIASAVAAFWEAVERGVQPPPILPQDRKTLAAMFPRDTGEELDWSGDNALPALLEERRTLRAATKTAEHRVAEIEDDVKMKIGAAAVATLPGWKITYRSQHRKEAVIPARDFRVLRISARNGDDNGQ